MTRDFEQSAAPGLMGVLKILAVHKNASKCG
jgi:hypothetical protein